MRRHGMQNQLNVVVLGNYVLSIRSEDSQIQEFFIKTRQLAKVLRVDEYSGSGWTWHWISTS
jgi:hypothetical protein